MGNVSAWHMAVLYCGILERDRRNESQLEKVYIALLLVFPSLHVSLDWWIQCATVLSTPLPLTHR